MSKTDPTRIVAILTVLLLAASLITGCDLFQQPEPIAPDQSREPAATRSGAVAAATTAASPVAIQASEPDPILGQAVLLTATLAEPDAGATYQWQHRYRDRWVNLGPAMTGNGMWFDFVDAGTFRVIAILSSDQR